MDKDSAGDALTDEGDTSQLPYPDIFDGVILLALIRDQRVGRRMAM